MSGRWRSVFGADLFRMYGDRAHRRWGRPLPLELRYLKRMRKAQCSSSRLPQSYHRFLLRRLSLRTQIQIPWCCAIGPGFYIGHLGRVIVHPAAVIGRNCNVATGVTIGAIGFGRREGAPILGDGVWVGTNAVIVGGVSIGTNVLIAPNAYVNFDVPSDSVVVGNPGVIHPSSHGASAYIQNPIG